jgi:hypothetical protein
VRLEGSLDAFSLPDIFQLLSFTKKTGGLHLRRDGLHGVVFVTTGSLTGGSSDVNRQGLARRLVGAGLVDDEALAGAVGAVEDVTELGVGRALQQQGAVDEAAMHEAAAEHVIDTVFDLMRWADGDFAFVVDEANPDDVGVSVSVEDAVAEARRRLEGWAQVSTTVPSPDTVLALALTPPDDPMLSREEWALLALVDGRRPVSDVVAAMGRGEFTVVSMLASLVERGLLVVTGENAPPGVSVLLRRLSSLASLEGVAPLPVEEPPAAPVEEGISARLGEALGDLTGSDDDEDDDFDVPEQVETPSQRKPLDAPARSPRAKADRADRADRADKAADGAPEVVEDYPAEVIPPRAEPFMPRRQPEHPDDDMPGDFAGMTAGGGGMPTVVGQVDGSSAIAAEPAASALIERDPSVNKSLLLRLIAGVRGL